MEVRQPRRYTHPDGRRGGDGQRGREDSGKAAAGGPSEVLDCGAGWAKLQLAGEAAAGGLGDRPTTQGSSGGK